MAARSVAVSGCCVWGDLRFGRCPAFGTYGRDGACRDGRGAGREERALATGRGSEPAGHDVESDRRHAEGTNTISSGCPGAGATTGECGAVSSEELMRRR